MDRDGEVRPGEALVVRAGGFERSMTPAERVAEALGISPGNVKVHVTLIGGGFGRKSKPDYVVEAALLAKVDVAS